jgi:hypothetical protein
MRVVATIFSKIGLWKPSANQVNPGDVINWFPFFLNFLLSFGDDKGTAFS